MKNLVSISVIVLGVAGLWYLARIVAFLAFMLLPVAVVIIAFYVVGYYTPKEFHDAFEVKLRFFLTWGQERTPMKLWFLFNGARSVLDWLGLQVKTA